ncbi:FAD-binding and (Fe-S)-binding domain-containing protein [Kaarinaea lacus]
MSNQQDTRLFQSLAKQIDGDVRHDDLNQMLYSTDASIYQHQPLAVVKPKHRDDCIKLVKFAREHQIPLIPRAAGTSLAGQVVGEAVVVDTSRYMNNIVEINVEDKSARVQPGVVLDILNQQIRKFDLQFAPDPSTASRCTVSGMIGNNAWGAHCPMYGTTREHILSLDNILSDGSDVRFRAMSQQDLTELPNQTSLQARLCNFVKDAIDREKQSILAAYPPNDVVPCNMGYPFHVLANSQPWNVQGAPFNMARFLCGTEGTLSLITEAKLKLVPLSRYRHMVGCHFHSLEQALHAVEIAMALKASAAELLDQYILSLTKSNLEQQRNRQWIDGDPESVLLVEFCGNNAGQLADQANTLIEQLKGSDLGYHYPQLINEQTDKAWAIRRAGLGLLMGSSQSRKPVSFIEDSAVAVNKLPQFIADFKTVLKDHEAESVFYGSVSMGLIHLRPMLDLKLHRDKQKLMALADATADLLHNLGGTMSAKHGDGIIRSHYIQKMLGDTVYRLIKETKQQFDPDSLFNPHKIVDSGAIDRDLRSDSSLSESNIKTYLDWSTSNGIVAAIENCNGAGVCRKPAGNGVMCPSYMVTLEEQHSTRGRANVIRQTLQQKGFAQGITDNNLKEVLKWCLSCKGCRSECPANVDIARFKIEHMQHYIKTHGTPLRAHVIRLYEQLSKLGSRFPNATNLFLNSHFVRSLLGYDARRRMPELRQQTLSDWFARHVAHKNAGQQGDIILLNNVFFEYYDVKVAIAAIEFLEYCGYQIELTPCFPSLRTVLSQGLIESARARLTTIIDYLHPRAVYNTPIIGLEPSETLTLRDEADSLAITEVKSKLEPVQRNVKLFEEFVSMERYKIESRNLDWKAKHVTVLLHGHCHQKSLIGLDSCHNALSLIPECGIETVPSGCCGMAGSFGYEKENYTMSMKVANLILFPAIRNASKDTTIVATGTSCRQQIRENMDVEPLHPAEVLRNAVVT